VFSPCGENVDTYCTLVTVNFISAYKECIQNAWTKVTSEFFA